jgi:hypothetical protein
MPTQTFSSFEAYFDADHSRFKEKELVQIVRSHIREHPETSNERRSFWFGLLFRKRSLEQSKDIGKQVFDCGMCTLIAGKHRLSTRLGRVDGSHCWSVCSNGDLSLGCCALPETEEWDFFCFPRLALVVGVCDSKPALKNSSACMALGGCTRMAILLCHWRRRLHWKNLPCELSGWRYHFAVPTASNSTWFAGSTNHTIAIIRA